MRTERMCRVFFGLRPLEIDFSLLSELGSKPNLVLDFSSMTMPRLMQRKISVKRSVCVPYNPIPFCVILTL